MYTSNKSEVWVSHHTSPHWAVEASQSNVGAWLNFHHLRCVVSLFEYALRLGITSGHCVVMRHNNEVNLKAKQRQLVISLRGLSVHTCTHEKVHFPQCVALENELIKLSQTAKLYCLTTGVASKCMNSGHIENNNKGEHNASCTFGEVKSIDIIWHSVWCSLCCGPAPESQGSLPLSCLLLWYNHSLLWMKYFQWIMVYCTYLL